LRLYRRFASSRVGRFAFFKVNSTSVRRTEPGDFALQSKAKDTYMSNQPSTYRHRTALKSAAMLVVFAAVAALSSGQVRGAMLDVDVSTWAPRLAKLARISGFTQVPGAIVQQGDTRTVPGAQ